MGCLQSPFFQCSSVFWTGCCSINITGSPGTFQFTSSLKSIFIILGSFFLNTTLSNLIFKVNVFNNISKKDRETAEVATASYSAKLLFLKIPIFLRKQWWKSCYPSQLQNKGILFPLKVLYQIAGASLLKIFSGILNWENGKKWQIKKEKSYLQNSKKNCHDSLIY